MTSGEKPVNTPADRLGTTAQIIETEAFWGLDSVSSRPGCRGGYLGRESIIRAAHISDESYVPEWIKKLAESDGDES